MIFWSLAIVITLIACAALYYGAVVRRVNAAAAAELAVERHFRLRLKEIETDLRNGELASDQAEAARAELARELMRQKAEAGPPTRSTPGLKFAIPASLIVVVLVSFGTYRMLGSPGLPAEPLATRQDVAARLDLDTAIAKIQAQLKKTPDDVRGWQVLAPVLLHEGRYAEAADAYRHVISLSGPTAENQTDLAVALIMQNNGDASGEPTKLLQSAAALDPKDTRSRFYLAGEAMRKGDYAAAVQAWKAVIALANGNEPWLATAKNGLETAEAALAGKPPPVPAGAGQLPDAQAVQGMVTQLAERLEAQGGSIEEWTRLVRSRLVLGQRAEAQQAYDAAKKAFPSAADRVELDNLALSNGLE